MKIEDVLELNEDSICLKDDQLFIDFLALKDGINKNNLNKLAKKVDVENINSIYKNLQCVKLSDESHFYGYHMYGGIVPGECDLDLCLSKGINITTESCGEHDLLTCLSKTTYLFKDKNGGYYVIGRTHFEDNKYNSKGKIKLFIDEDNDKFFVKVCNAFSSEDCLGIGIGYFDDEVFDNLYNFYEDFSYVDMSLSQVLQNPGTIYIIECGNKNSLYNWIKESGYIPDCLDGIKDKNLVKDIAKIIVKKHLKLGHIVPYNCELLKYGIDFDTEEYYSLTEDPLKNKYVFPKYYKENSNKIGEKRFENLNEAEGLLKEWEDFYYSKSDRLNGDIATRCREISKEIRNFDFIKIIYYENSDRNYNLCSVVLGKYELYKSGASSGVVNVGLYLGGFEERKIGTLRNKNLKFIKSQNDIEEYLEEL